MPKTVTIKLADLKVDPLTGHHGLIQEIVLREPTFDEYVELGEPRQFYFMADGQTAVPIDDPATVGEYMRRCLVSPTDPSLLAQGGLKLARAMKAKVIGFFRFGDEEDEASTSSPTTSSSTDASASTLAA